MKRFIYIEELDFIASIAINKKEKLNMQFLFSGKRYLNFRDVQTLEEITVFLMKKKGKSNVGFLLWMFAVGEHLKEIFNGKWMLEKRSNILGEYFVPLIIDSKNDIWMVGDFCYSLYFNKDKKCKI